jgi:hypothetical protein
MRAEGFVEMSEASEQSLKHSMPSLWDESRNRPGLLATHAFQHGGSHFSDSNQSGTEKFREFRVRDGDPLNWLQIVKG